MSIHNPYEPYVGIGPSGRLPTLIKPDEPDMSANGLRPMPTYNADPVSFSREKPSLKIKLMHNRYNPGLIFSRTPV